MSAEKLTVRHGVLGKLEGSYNEGIATTAPAAASDGLLPEEEFVATLESIHSGEREADAGAGGRYKRAPASGRVGTFTLPVVARGAGSAYSATVVPPELHTLLRVAGHSATLDATTGAEKYTYAPDRDAADSAAFELYGRGQKWPLTGVLATMGFEVEAGGFLRFSFDAQGVGGTVADASRPSITLDGQEPPKAESLSVTIGNYTGGVVRAIRFTQNRELGRRTDLNTDGFAGVAPGPWDPTLEIDLEMDALAGASPWHAAGDLDPYRLFDDAEAVSVGFTVGTDQYNKIKVTAPQAQMSGYPQEGEDGPTGVWTLPFTLPQSAPAADDEYSIVLE